eukprot:XP_001704671.1 Hypothetical protein GL50803_119130 [Giardia lamblia ATCC 50803]
MLCQGGRRGRTQRTVRSRLHLDEITHLPRPKTGDLLFSAAFDGADPFSNSYGGSSGGRFRLKQHEGRRPIGWCGSGPITRMQHPCPCTNSRRAYRSHDGQSLPRGSCILRSADLTT